MLQITPIKEVITTLHTTNKIVSEPIVVTHDTNIVIEKEGTQTLYQTSSAQQTTITNAGEFVDTDIDIFVPNTSTPAKIILVAGQSNAEGRGVKSQLSSEEQASLEVISNVKMLRHTRGPFTDKVIIVNESADAGFGYGAVISGETTFGPELGLADYLREHCADETFYIVKYAFGGSGLARDWWVNHQPGRLLRALMQKTENAMQYLQQQNMSPQIVAMCWMQGEADSSGNIHTQEYAQNTTEMVQYLRDKYKRYTTNKGLWWIDAGISDARRLDGRLCWPEYEAVNNSKKAVGKALSSTWYIDTIQAGLTTLDTDRAHYDTNSTLKLGRLFGAGVAHAVLAETRNVPYRKAPQDRQDRVVAPQELYDVANYFDKISTRRAATLVSDEDGEYVRYKCIEEVSYMEIPLLTFSPANTLLDITYRSTKDYNTTWYPHPYREQRTGGEMYPVSGQDRLLLENTESVWKTKTIDLSGSYYYPEYGYYLANLALTIDNITNGDIIDIKSIKLHE